MNKFRFLAFGALFLEALFLPFGKFSKAFTADAKLDDVQRHKDGFSQIAGKRQTPSIAQPLRTWQHCTNQNIGGNWTMAHKTGLRITLALALVVAGAATACAQPIFDRARENAERRADNQAERDAENPPPAKPAAATPAPATDTAAPAAPANPAPAAPAQTPTTTPTAPAQ
jgi:hypothetical protein